MAKAPKICAMTATAYERGEPTDLRAQEDGSETIDFMGMNMVNYI